MPKDDFKGAKCFKLLKKTTFFISFIIPKMIKICVNFLMRISLLLATSLLRTFYQLIITPNP